MDLDKVKNFLNKYDRFLITAHKRPEGDSIGSQVAMALLLKKLKKEVVVVNEDPIPPNLDFIKFCEIKEVAQARGAKFDAAIVLDSGNLSRIGKVVNLLKSSPTINIDHHISNDNFGEVNWVNAKVSSVSEMIFYLYREVGVELDEKSALCIYVGILTDTGCFRFSNTTPQALDVCSQLLKFDIQPERVSNLLYSRRSFGSIRLLGEALVNLKKDKTGQIAWISITQQMLRKFKTRKSDTDDFIEFVRMIEPVKVAIVFHYINERKTKVSFRSKGEVDVNSIASFFKGGGHKLASGAEINYSLEEAEDVVLKKVRERIAGQ